MNTVHTVVLAEDERQMILLALGELSILRPGWLDCLERIALKMDNLTVDGRAQMFEQFRRNHSNPLAEVLAHGPKGYVPDPGFPPQTYPPF